MVNFYRDVWRRRSHILAPLTALVSPKAKYVWGAEQQKAFDDMKKIISKETLLNFPDFNKEFHIYPDASDYQLSAVIMQDNKPLAFYSRKINQTQKNYTTGEQELLSIVETLKEFRNILLGQKLIVHTDHKNIVYGNLSNGRIARWRLLLEEYGPTYVHIAGKDNHAADALSRLEANFNLESEQRRTNKHKSLKTSSPQYAAYYMANSVRDEAVVSPSVNNNAEMSFAFNTNEVDERFPLSSSLIAIEQRKDKTLQHAISNEKSKF